MGHLQTEGARRRRRRRREEGEMLRLIINSDSADESEAIRKRPMGIRNCLAFLSLELTATFSHPESAVEARIIMVIMTSSLHIVNLAWSLLTQGRRRRT